MTRPPLPPRRLASPKSRSSSAPSSDVAFTPAVKAMQERRGSRRAYSAMEKRGGWRVPIDSELAAFVAAQTSVFFATASLGGQPYVQHRGGPPGFLRVLDESTLAFADFAGNRQYITLGNLSENPRAQLLLLDYAQRRRVKIWGEARVVENDAELIASLMPRDYEARAEQAIVFSVSAWDSNCRQHIPQRLEAADVTEALRLRDEKIAALEAEVRRLRVATPGSRLTVRSSALADDPTSNRTRMRDARAFSGRRARSQTGHRIRPGRRS